MTSPVTDGALLFQRSPLAGHARSGEDGESHRSRCTWPSNVSSPTSPRLIRDGKKYKDRLVAAQKQTGEKDALVSMSGTLLGMPVVMDHGWIVTHGGEGSALAQVSFASEGGSGTAVPDLSIEVDNLQQVLERMRAAGIPLEYGPADEPWGVRRFFVRDPFGRLLNILAHR